MFIIFFCSFFISAIATFLLIKYQNKKMIFNQQRNLGIQMHAQKSSVPSLGGVAIFFGIFVSSIIFVEKKDILFLLLLFISSFFFIGFLDDILKIKNKNNPDKLNILGLSGKLRIVLEVIISATFCIFLSQKNLMNTSNLIVPFAKTNLHLLPCIYLSLKIFVIISSVNSANIVDGLDGLLTKNIIIIFAALLFYYVCASDEVLSWYFSINHNAVIKEFITFILIILGTLLAFSFFNNHPASIFMGDCGSIMLGAILGLLIVLVNQELFLIFYGFMFIVETLSVIIQTTYFKYTKRKFGVGRRIFKCSPIHHHFEKSNIHEAKIVSSFTLITIVTTLLGIYAIFTK
jgi:phospho-N-acetylmuramoyl-pentapeptide-transferase